MAAMCVIFYNDWANSDTAVSWSVCKKEQIQHDMWKKTFLINQSIIISSVIVVVHQNSMEVQGSHCIKNMGHHKGVETLTN